MVMSSVAASPTSVNRTSPLFSPTSVFQTPTSVGYVPSPVNPNPSLKVDTSPSAHLNPAPTTSAASNAASLSATLSANASKPFLKVSMPDGSTVYAEFGRVVPAARFNNDIAAASLKQTLQQNNQPFVQIQSPTGIIYAAHGTVVRKAQFDQDMASYNLSQTLKQNASQSFVQIQTDSGTIYAEKGVQVSADQYQRDLQKAQSPSPTTVNLFSRLSLKDQGSALNTLSSLITQLKAGLGSSPSSDKVNAYNKAVNTYNAQLAIYNAGVGRSNAASQAQQSSVLSLSGQTLTALTISQYLSNEGLAQPTITVNGKSMTLSQYAQQNPTQKFTITTTQGADGSVSFSLKSATSAGTSKATGGNVVERAAASAFGDITAGFSDLFRAGASTGLATRQAASKVGIGRPLPKGTQVSDLSLLGISETQAEQFAGSTAGYLFPGAAVLKGIGSPGEGTPARLFDIGVGILPFLPVGEAAAAVGRVSARGASVVRAGGSFAGRTLLGAGFGAAGGIAYGESPLQIGESALLGGIFGGPGGSILGRLTGSAITEEEPFAGPKLYSGTGRSNLRTAADYGRGGYSQEGIYAVRDPLSGEVRSVERIPNPAMAGLAKSDLLGAFEKLTTSQLDIKDLPGIQASMSGQFSRGVAARAEALGSGGPGEANFIDNLLAGMRESTVEEANKPLPDYINRTLHPEQYVDQPVASPSKSSSTLRPSSSDTGFEFKSGSSTVVLRPPTTEEGTLADLQRSVEKSYESSPSYRPRRGRSLLYEESSFLTTPEGFSLAAEVNILGIFSQGQRSSNVRGSSLRNVIGSGVMSFSILGLGNAQSLGLAELQSTSQVTSESQVSGQAQTQSEEQVLFQRTKTSELSVLEDLSSLRGVESLTGTGLFYPLPSDDSTKRRRSKKVKTVNRPTKVRNRLALEISGSFGDVAEDLLSSDNSSGIFDFGGAQGILGGLF